MKRAGITRRIRDCIRENLLNPQLGVEFLADHCGISYSYLYEIINMAYDMSPRQLIEAMRLDQALDDLAQDQCSILQICKKVGYTNSKTFRRAFKNRLKIRPVDCRNILRMKSCHEDELKRLKAILWKQDQEIQVSG